MARDMFIVFFWSQSIPVPTSCNIVPQHLGFPLQKPSRIAWLWAFTRTWHHRCCQGKSETLFRLAAGKMDVSWMSAEQMFLFFFFWWCCSVGDASKIFQGMFSLLMLQVKCQSRTVFVPCFPPAWYFFVHTENEKNSRKLFSLFISLLNSFKNTFLNHLLKPSFFGISSRVFVVDRWRFLGHQTGMMNWWKCYSPKPWSYAMKVGWIRHETKVIWGSSEARKRGGYCMYLKKRSDFKRLDLW